MTQASASRPRRSRSRRHPRAPGDFLVAHEREHEVRRRHRVGFDVRLRHREHRGDCPLHVGRAAPVKPVADSLAERVARPLAGLERDRIEVPQQDERPVCRTRERRHEIRFLGVRGDALGVDAEFRKERFQPRREFPRVSRRVLRVVADERRREVDDVLAVLAEIGDGGWVAGHGLSVWVYVPVTNKFVLKLQYWGARFGCLCAIVPKEIGSSNGCWVGVSADSVIGLRRCRSISAGSRSWSRIGRSRRRGRFHRIRTSHLSLLR